ncbi:hypothetical protein PV05_09106 [Exophiala xenobiotica]|uniref:Phytanoyl-CoA dioxygenase n=1 Tax=Exophiala xenobiotica TaxID=348802 RepID=A0A0D2EG14_9EURO|nr:uncharacterized protein PV05_09106 [Exophiala xenobiotica]KIW53545.1 hypothetical protein PV05_09106 [Exophiala xenobiotica]
MSPSAPADGADVSDNKNHNIAPPTIKYDDVHILFDKLQQAHATKYPPRPRLEVPEYTPDANPDDVADGLKRVGGVIVRGILSQEAIAQIECDMRPHLESDIPWTAGNDFFPPSTRRAFGLIGKSRTAALELIGNDLYQAVCKQFLTTKAYAWYGDRNEVSISPPQVNNTIVFSVRPGDSFDQPLHRDDDIHYANRLRVDKYPELQTHETNGATRFIPGSHLEDTAQPPDEKDAVHAELNPGDGFIMLSSCYHGGSKNTTMNEERLVFSCFMTRGYLRQEENQYLCVPLDVAKSLPLRIQKLMGYAVSEPMLGWVDFKDPRVILDPKAGRVAHKY